MRLIRSKGVGVFFVTQLPNDVPADVLGQLGDRVQHALRAFTPDDAKALKAAVSTYPKSDFYDLGELLTPLGIGEAVVTMLSSQRRADAGRAHAAARAPLAHGAGRRRRRAPPRPRRCGPSTARASTPRARARCWPRGWPSGPPPAPAQPAPAQGAPAGAPAPKPAPQPKDDHKAAGAAVAGGAAVLGKFLTSRQGQAVGKEVVRGLFGLLKR